MVKKISAVTLLLVFVISIFAPSVMGFNFPEPDWGALYYEKMDMVKETEFELYTEGPVDSAPYYGAKHEPVGGAYLGTVPHADTALLPTSTYLTYFDGMDQSDFYYPDKGSILENNVVVMTGWTVYDINTVDYNQVRRVLETLNGYNKPIFVRFANEMNVSALGDEPDKYIEVFRTVADMVHEYPNLAIVWSPCDMGALDRPFEYYYPGDEYVDWIGVSCYMLQYFMGNKNAEYKSTVYFMTSSYAWATNKLKPLMDFMEKNNIQKPVMISEGGVSTNNNYGDDCQNWATPRLRNMLWSVIMKYPQVKMINYFDVYRGNEVEKYNISPYPYAVEIFNEAKACGAYIPEYGVDPEFVFAKADAGYTLPAKNGKVNLYAHAYLADTDDIDVHYFIDGEWSGVSYNIPFKYELDVTGLADGKHQLQIKSACGEKSYTFYKAGNAIRFGGMPEIVEEPIKIKVNGKEIKFDAAPVIVDDRTLVPVRAIFEALGASVDWNAQTRTAKAVGRGKTVEITIDEMTFKKNGEAVALDVPAQIISDRTFVPARAVAEAFDCKVTWDGATRTVIIEG